MRIISDDESSFVMVTGGMPTEDELEQLLTWVILMAWRTGDAKITVSRYSK